MANLVNLGKQAKAMQQILLRPWLITVQDKKLVIHHIIDNPLHVVVMVERQRFDDTFLFERVTLDAQGNRK